MQMIEAVIKPHKLDAVKGPVAEERYRMRANGAEISATNVRSLAA